jgi:hypothetical protein
MPTDPGFRAVAFIQRHPQARSRPCATEHRTITMPTAFTARLHDACVKGARSARRHDRNGRCKVSKPDPYWLSSFVEALS